MARKKDGLTPTDRKALAAFRKTMNEKVIPEIVRDVRRRQELAAESRHWFVT